MTQRFKFNLRIFLIRRPNFALYTTGELKPSERKCSLATCVTSSESGLCPWAPSLAAGWGDTRASLLGGFQGTEPLHGSASYRAWPALSIRTTAASPASSDAPLIIYLMVITTVYWFWKLNYQVYVKIFFLHWEALNEIYDIAITIKSHEHILLVSLRLFPESGGACRATRPQRHRSNLARLQGSRILATTWDLTCEALC